MDGEMSGYRIHSSQWLTTKSYHASLQETFFWNALPLRNCQYFVFSSQNPYRCWRIILVEFWKVKILLTLWGCAIAHEWASHDSLPVFRLFPEILLQKRDPTFFIVFLLPNRVQLSIKRGKWMEKCQYIASPAASGEKLRASQRPCWKPCFGMHYRSYSANI